MADEEQFKEVLKFPVPKVVPLTIMIGGEKRIVGKAKVEADGHVQALIDMKDGVELAGMITDGVIESVSVSFHTPPPAKEYKPGELSEEAIQNLTNYLAEKESLPEKYRFELPIMDLEKRFPPIKGIDYVGLESKPMPVEPFKDKFPYGTAPE